MNVKEAFHKYLHGHQCVGECFGCNELILVVWTFEPSEGESFESHLCLREDSEFFGKHVQYCPNCHKELADRLFPDIDRAYEEMKNYELTKNDDSAPDLIS